MLNVLSLDELEPLARAGLPQASYDYIAGGADDEWTVQANTTAYRHIQLLPRVLRDVSQRAMTTTILGTDIALPILIAPMAFHGLATPNAELATARAAAAAGTVYIASTAANRSIEQIAAVGAGTRWFQLYVYRDRAITRMLVERAAAAGFSALCVTVDTPLVGKRRRDIRNAFTLPQSLELANFHDSVMEDLPQPARESGLAAYVASQWDAGLTWETMAWLQSISPMPVVVKGIMAPDDARLAVEHGIAAIVVSNHGGRQLDTAPATITMLPHIADAVAGRCEVLIDGGIRRGTDVLKALALGAKAVLVGRPIMWGLTLDGEAGAKYVLDLLRAELDLAMVLAGCSTLADVSRELIWGMRDRG